MVSHKLYSNSILNFQEFTTILNACTKKSGNLLNAPRITNNSIKSQSFVYTHLNDQTVLFITIQFSISHLFALSLNVKQFYLTHRKDPIRCYYSRSEWTWKWWQLRDTPHSPNHWNWSLTIRLFNVTFRAVISREEVLFLCRDTVYSTASTNWADNIRDKQFRFGLVMWFNGISTLEGYLMPNFVIYHHHVLLLAQISLTLSLSLFMPIIHLFWLMF